jgi:dTDP-4-amino-4,6-dideoxygalactose transaminase
LNTNNSLNSTHPEFLRRRHLALSTTKFDSDLPHIPVADLSRRTQKYRGVIDEAIGRVLDRSNFVLGREVESFEKSFAEYIGTKFCVGVANGTDAIELSLKALGVTAEDRVATVANAGNYASNAICAIGAKPLYLDVEFATRNVSVNEIQRAIRMGVKAIVVTHLYGMAVSEIEEISRLCAEAGVGLLEDCAQAHGAEINGRKVGAFGDLASFSFYPTKNLGALGDGGAVTTSNAALANTLKNLRIYGWTSKYQVSITGGRNSRLDEMQASILNALLPSLDDDNQHRRDIALSLKSQISNTDLQLPTFESNEYVGHLFVLSTPNRDAVRTQLTSMGIDTAIHYPIADHKQPINQNQYKQVELPATESLCDEVFSIPCFPELTQIEINRIISAVNLVKG